MRHLLKEGLPVALHNKNRGLATGRYCQNAYKYAQKTFAAPRPVILPPPASVSLRIREAAYVDAEDVGNINVEAWQSTYRGIMPDAVLKLVTKDRFELRWEDLLIDPAPDCFTLIAEDADAGPVGFIRGGPCDGQNKPKAVTGFDWEIFAINVLPRFQRFGVGRELMLEAMVRILMAGGSSCYAWVLKDNSRARFFFKHLEAEFIGKGLEKLGKAKLHKQAYGWEDLTELNLTDELVARMPLFDDEEDGDFYPVMELEGPESYQETGESRLLAAE